MKLTYWVAECQNDSPAYNVRKKTKKEVVAAIANDQLEGYGPPHKVEVEYDDGFDLLCQCLGEGGVYESEEK